MSKISFKKLTVNPKEIKRNFQKIHSLIDVDCARHEPKVWSVAITRLCTTTAVPGEERRPIYYWLIYGLLLTACALVVVQSDGWSRDYCQRNLCVKYRPVDAKQFCRITNFQASYKRAHPIEVVLVIPEKDGSCGLVLNSITQRQSNRLHRKYDHLSVKETSFVTGKNHEQKDRPDFN